MEYGNRGGGRGTSSTVAAPLAAAAAAAGSVVATYNYDGMLLPGSSSSTPLGAPSPAGSVASFQAAGSAGSGTAPRPTLKPFGPVQQHHGSKTNGNAGNYCFASGLPARRRLLGRRQQQQAQKQGKEQGGIMTNNNTTTPGSSAGGSPGAETSSSTRCSSPKRKRPTIKEFLGVNPADLIVPLLSPPQKKGGEENKQGPTKDAPQKLTHDGAAASSARNPPQQQEEVEAQRQTPAALRQTTSSVLPSFLARLLLPFGGGDEAATGNAEKASKTNQDDAKEIHRKQKQQERNNQEHAAAAAESQCQVTGRPPGIIVRPNAPLVPAFNASDGIRPVWTPVVYDPEPIYLMPDGTVSNTGINTRAATTNATAPFLRKETQTVATVPGCAVSTVTSCAVNAASGVPTSERRLPSAAAGYGSSALQRMSCPAIPGDVRRTTSDGLLLRQSPAPLTASSSLAGAEDCDEETQVPLTNYQRYLRWKEQQRRQQLLNQQLQMEQQQRQITAQWMNTIESLLPQAQSRGSYYRPPTQYANDVPNALARGQHYYQGPPLHVQQQQQLQPFDQQQQQPPLLDAQQQMCDSRQQLFASQQQKHLMPEQQALVSQQHLQMFSDRRRQQQWGQQQFNLAEMLQPQQQYDDRQQVQNALLRNSATTLEQELDLAASTTINNHQQQSVQQPQQRFLQEGQLGGDNHWQGLMQWEAAKSGLQQGLQDESCQGGALAPSHPQFYSQSQTDTNGCLPQTSLCHYSMKADMRDPPLERQNASSTVPWMSGSNNLQNTSGAAYPVDVEDAGQQMQEGQGANDMPNFFSQPAYVPQPVPFSHAMRPVAGSPFHPGFNYAEGISVHYNYYDAEEWTTKLQAAATQREYSGSTEAGAEQEALRNASAASLSICSDVEEDGAAALGLKPLLTSKQRLPSGQVFTQ